MSSNQFASAIEKLKNAQISIDEPRPQTDQTIKALENRLGVLLPISYKKMLYEFGNLGFGPVEFYGITKGGFDAMGAPNVVFLTEKSRLRNEISDQMVYIMASGYGPFFVIDCNERNAIGESPILEIDEFGFNTGSKRAFDSFGEFCLHEVDMYISSRR